MAMAIGILARVVDIKLVMRVLDQRNRQPASFEQLNYLFEQSRFAATRPAGEANNFHKFRFIAFR
jgi:hypothetical protein